MRKEIIDFLYKEYRDAIDYLNETSLEIGEEEFESDHEIIEENFNNDLYMLAFFAVCADGVISDKEVENIHEISDMLGFEMDLDDRQCFIDAIRENPFDIPKTLVVFVLRAYMKKVSVRTEYNEGAVNAELRFIEAALCIYAEIMCAMAERVTEKEKKVILDCLNTCCEYVSEAMHIDFSISDEVKDIIDNAING